MFQLVLFLFLTDPAIDSDHGGAAPVVGIYASYAACDAARWRLWREQWVPPALQQSAPAGLHWRQSMPGDCEPLAAAGV